METSLSDLRELFKAYTNTPYEALLVSARDSLVRLRPFFAAFREDFMQDYLLNFVSTAIASDGCMTEGEYHFFCDLTGCDKPFEQVGEAISCYDTPSALELVDEVFDAIPHEGVRKDLLNLLLSVFASDSIVAFDESLLFLRLLH